MQIISVSHNLCETTSKFLSNFITNNSPALPPVSIVRYGGYYGSYF
jgi:hypothetical protein